MKIILGILILFFTFPTQDNIKMRWRNDNPLVWDDFRGKPTGSSEYVASTNSGISFSSSYKIREQQITLDYTITAFFYPELSWYREGIVNNRILKHEQTHFNITQLFARKVRKQLTKTSYTKNIQKEIEAIYQTIEKERQELQHRYDYETEHSKNEEKEQQWQFFIKTELKKLEDWNYRKTQTIISNV